jgi:hypothetical protein
VAGESVTRLVAGLLPLIFVVASFGVTLVASRLLQ